jgi:hypothetical protein
MGLFDGPSDRAECLAEVKRAINAKVGRFAIRSAATLPLAWIPTEGKLANRPA